MNEKNCNLVQIFQIRVIRFDHRPCLYYKDQGRYLSWTWKETETFARRTTLALYALGVRKGDRVGLLSENRPEWIFADLGILGLGAINVPVYPTSSAEDIKNILDHAGITILFVSSDMQREKIKGMISDSAAHRKTVQFDPSSD